MNEADPVEVARRVNDAFSSIPFEQLKQLALGSDSYEEAGERARKLGYGILFDAIDPEIEVVAGGFPAAATLPSGRGAGVWLAYWREWLEPWEEVTFEARDYEQRGSWVLVDALVTARGEKSGVPVELPITQLWRVEGGRGVGYAVYETREEAEAAIEDAG